jgi:hypothetical protein
VAEMTNTNSDSQHNRQIDTDGGSYFEGDIDTDGGDVIGGDKIINYQLDIEKLVEVLRQSLPDDDPTPQRLHDTLQGFQHFHSQLFEWKELHNYLNDILYVLDQFTREVERVDAGGQSGNPRALTRLWRPIVQKLLLLLDWAGTVHYIHDTPYIEQEDGSLQGPKWAVELQIARIQVDEALKPDTFDFFILYDAAFEFNGAVDRHMYLADKKLRDTAGELYNLSRIVLGSVDQ